MQRKQTVATDIDSLLSRVLGVFSASDFLLLLKMESFRSFSLGSKIREPLSIDLIKHYRDSSPPSSPKSKGMLVYYFPTIFRTSMM